MQLASVAFTLLVTMCTLLNHIIMIIVIIRTYSQNINFVEITVYCQKNNVSYARKWSQFCLFSSIILCTLCSWQCKYDLL